MNSFADNNIKFNNKRKYKKLKRLYALFKWVLTERIAFDF